MSIGTRPAGPAKPKRRPSLGAEVEPRGTAVTPAPREGTRPARSRSGRLAEEVERLKRELAAAEAENLRLAQLVVEDPLTGVLNRRGFDRELGRAVAYLSRYGGEASLVAFDLDDFKTINDTQGHGAGDDVLRAVAASLRAMIRSSDTLARVGGDEFLLILWHAGVEAASAKAARLSAALPIAAAWGVAAVEGADPRAVVARADAALYAMKRQRQVRR